MESSQGVADLDDKEGRSSHLRENEVANEESNGADEMVTEATYCKDLNNDGEGLARKEVWCEWEWEWEWVAVERKNWLGLGIREFRVWYGCIYIWVFL